MGDGLDLLVPVDKSAASLRGLELACRLAGSNKRARLHVVYVVEVNRRVALDAELPGPTEEGERRISEAERRARRDKIPCDGDILQAREAGTAIVDEAVELNVDTIVMGVTPRAREGAPLGLGKTVEYVLRHAPCQVVVVQDEAPQ